MIICGDHGGVWAGEQADRHHLDWLENKPFTTLFVDGNHENFDLLNAYPDQEWHGGRVHVVRPHVLHLMRGQVFDIGGLTHCAPSGIAQRMNRHYQPDRLTDFLETVRQRCRFSRWFCGHYHINQVIDERFVIQWEQISRIEADCI